MSLETTRDELRGGAVVTTRPSVVAGALVVFCTSAYWASSRDVDPVETALFRAVNNLPDSGRALLTAAMQAGALPSVGVVSVTALARKRRREAAVLAAAGTFTWLACKVVKRLVGRGRPADDIAGVDVRGRAQTGLGFPSGHAAVAFTLARAARPIVPRSARVASLVLASIVGFARIYVGAHLPADVIGGAALGTAVGEFAAGQMGHG